MSSGKAEALSGLHDLIADSPTFRARCNYGGAPVDRDGAIAHIGYATMGIAGAYDPNNTLAGQRPLALVYVVDHQYTCVGEELYLVAGGGVAVQIQDIPRSDDRKAAWLDFEDFIGGIVDDIVDLVPADRPDLVDVSYFPFRHIMQFMPTIRSNMVEGVSDDFFMAEYLFRFGVE